LSARMRRIASDYEQVMKEFAGHPYIRIQPENQELPEKYQVTYFVNGIYLLPDGKMETIARHEIEIELHAEYPRYKPVCKIITPIWHPNFRDGQICIGDIWGAGESLSDIIIDIGDMIQYKSWNSYSPLSAEAAKWAFEHKHLFPIGNLELRRADYHGSREEVEIDFFDENDQVIAEAEPSAAEFEEEPAAAAQVQEIPASGNDFEISGEDLAGIEFVPTAQRMQTISHGGTVDSRSINFKTVAMKGLLWGIIGGLLGWFLQEILNMDELVYNAYEFDGVDDYLVQLQNAIRVSAALSTAFVAIGIGALLGLGEGIYYGSKTQAFKNLGIGAAVSAVLGFISGYIAQSLYSAMLSQDVSEFAASFIRGIGWAVMGAGIGLAAGLIKPEKKRILYCALGGLIGGFVGGFLFNYVYNIFSSGEMDTGAVPRAIGFIVMGLLIGLGVGLLEQFAKSAWLKVVRGEFEGKEYLVFAGTTSIGSTGKNTIVLFKDKLVAPNHCEIILEGNRYVVQDKGSPLGTVVNGRRIVKHVLRQGDAIAIGNSVLVFQSR